MSLFVGIQDAIIQKFAIRIAGGYISAKTGADIQIGRLYIAPNFTIHIDEFLVKDLKDNNLLKVEHLKVRPIMEDIVHGNIHVGRVELTDAEANLITYKDSTAMNFQFLIDAFSSGEQKESGATPKIQVDRIILRDLDFQLWDQNRDDPTKTENHEIDYSHLVLNDIDLDYENLVIHEGAITGVIHRLAAHEISGFNLKHLETNVAVSPQAVLLDGLYIETDSCKLDLDLHFSYNGFQAFSHFVDSVVFDTKIRPSEVTLSDIGPFAGVLYDMTDKVNIESIFKGTISELNLSNLKFSFGQQTQFVGNLTLHPLDILHKRNNLKINRLNFSYDDLASFHIPGSSKTIPIPPSLAPLGSGSIEGSLAGSMNNLKVQLAATTGIGSLIVKASMLKPEKDYMVFEGQIDATKLDVGILANASNIIGTLDVTADVAGRFHEEDGLDLDVDGSILNTLFLGNTIDEISLNGNLHKQRFNGKFNIDDNDLDLGFKGSFDFSNPKALSGNFKADIYSANLQKLNLIKNKENAVFSAIIDANMSSINDFNNAAGTLSITNMSYQDSTGFLDMKRLDASIVNDAFYKKRINLDCDFLDFEMAGQMDFSTLLIALKQYVNTYVTIPQWTDELEAFEASEQTVNQDFLINMKIKNPKPITNYFIPNLNIAKNTTLNGTFTSRSNSLNLTLRSNYIKFNEFRINDIECKGRSYRRQSTLNLSLDEIILRDSTAHDPSIISIDDFNLLTTLRDDTIHAKVTWNDTCLLDHNAADIHAFFLPQERGGMVCIDKASILLNDSLWTFNPTNRIVIDSGLVNFHNLELIGNNQSLLVDGNMPKQAEDTLSVVFNRFNLSTFDFLFKGMGFDLDGLVFGNAKVNNLSNDMTLLADLGLKDFGFNGQPYGDVSILSQWNNASSAVDVDLNLTNQGRKTLGVVGSLYPLRQTDNLDFKITIDSLNLQVLSPFLAGAVSRLNGYCFGHVDVGGSLKEPDFLGQLRVKDGGCKVNYLNTYYTFSPTITLSDNLFTLEDFYLVDTLGHSALATGFISHNHLKDIRLNINLYPMNFLAMATTANISPTFYGTAVANGIVSIKGPLNNLNLNIHAQTRDGTTITLPLGGTSTVKKHDFITFVSPPPVVNEEEEEEPAVQRVVKQSSNLDIALNLDVNNAAQVKIALPNGLGSIEAKGDGNIKIDVGTANNTFSLIGDYVISSGSIALNIQDLIKKNFTMEPGSRISWTGDPVNGTINATGVYQTKASLGSLGLVDSTSMSTNSVKVECLVHLKNKLLNPDISFSLRLPNASEDIQQAVFYVIDTTNQAEVLKQTIYLLVMNSFNYGGNSSGYYGIITSQLNDFVSELTNLDINFNYRPGDDITSEEMTVELRKQLFNNRLTIETNFGVIRPTNVYSSSSSNIVGDFNIDYKITPDGRFSAQMFNRSNYNNIYYQYTYYKMAPYTQGLGLSYNKSFNRIKDIFRRRSHIDLPNRPIMNVNRRNQNNEPTQNEPEP